jgi:hypothetical protein
MLSDPRIGYFGSLGIAAVALLWLIAQWLASDAIWHALWPFLGYGTHAVTLLSIFLLLAAPLVSLLFRRYARVKSDLMAGRDVIARWTVDPKLFQTFGTVAEARDRNEKRGALYVILVFILVIFGLFALYDPEFAPQMLIAGGAIALVMTVAFWLSNRVRKQHLKMRSGEIIVGPQGLLVNDVLHVWATPLSWLSRVDLEQGPPVVMTITYAIVGRSGTQHIGVMLPVPPEATQQAEEVRRRLSPHFDDRAHRGRRVTKKHNRTSRHQSSRRNAEAGSGAETSVNQ